jgi:AcrR family transcriptional regulator
MPVNDMAERPNQRSKPAPKAGRSTGTDTSRPPAAGAKALKGRAQKAAERREAILAAALDEFAARGYAATRIDDVAERAGVAKGTIYLHFADKEALFQEIVRTMVVPRREIIRLMLTEGPRFPALAEFYYREVVERAIVAMRALLTRAYERGELKSDALVRFPHLIVSPLMLSVLWSGLFDRFSPLDVTALMRAHLDLLFGKEQAS